MSRIQVTPAAAAEIALLRERIRTQDERLKRIRAAGATLAAYAPAHEVRAWKRANQPDR